jgi:phage N-6-adenine-methyltransferase
LKHLGDAAQTRRRSFFWLEAVMSDVETAPKTSEWRTPKYIFDALKVEFDLDVAHPGVGAGAGVCHVPTKRFFTKADNGLLQPWPKHALVWDNPPYSEAGKKHGIVEWVEKSFEHGNGILLIPARTSCDWWAYLVFPHAQLICFPDRKISFLEPDGRVGGSNSLGSALVGMGEVACNALRQSGLGHCVVVDRSAALPARPRGRAQRKSATTGPKAQSSISMSTSRVLRKYQQSAATFLFERDAAVLIAPLGAGKGAAALTAGAELIRDGHRRHALVIAPKLVAETVWPQEVAAWAHLRHLSVAVLDGSPERRHTLLATAAERQLTVIGVDLVPWLVDGLATVPDSHPLFDLLVIDETSRLKDPSGKRARALLKVARRFKTRWGLTGTPRPNSAMDLFMPAAIITDGALWGRAFIPWQKRHFRPRDPFGREWRPLPGAEEKIAADFSTVAMTVSDADMPDLPPLNVVVTPVTLPDAVMVTYATMQEELFAAIDGRGIEAVSPLVATGKCAQIANGFVYDEGNADPVAIHEVKIDWLRELVESLDGEPLLIAYEFIEDLRTIRRAFGAVPVLGNPTPAREAARLIEAWNAGELPLLAFHPASASHGLNLQHGGSRMAWLSPSWSAELTEQAIARIYRPGQTRHVTIHVCVAAGTVDEMKRDRVLGKMSAQDAFRRHLERV